MKHLIRLTDLNVDTVYKIFEIADELPQGKYKDALKGKTVVMFFPNTSIRTRVTFEKGNIGLAWKEASEVLGFSLEQCCAKGYEIEGLVTYQNIYEAVKGKDIICTDSIPQNELEEFKACQVTKKVMDRANVGALLNPCPPFYRGEEVSKDAIESDYFAGYEFKKCLLEVQQAAILYSLS